MRAPTLMEFRALLVIAVLGIVAMVREHKHDDARAAQPRTVVLQYDNGVTP